MKIAGPAYNPKSLINLQGGLLPYFPDPVLVQAITIARLLMRPLLLRGEPGCGKTRFAEALAFGMYGEKYEKHLYKWSIKSTSKLADGIYTYDHLARLRDVQSNNDEDILRSKNKKSYRFLGPIGEAFKSSTVDKPSILLIDEIDKADVDFPNDLLELLEWAPGKTIDILESQEKIMVTYPPIVIITSNDEKELPGPFLRRCVFHYLDFPDESHLLKIATGYLTSLDQNPISNEQVKELIDRFLNLRKEMAGRAITDKLPATSELLDWLKVHAYEILNGNLQSIENENGLDFAGVLLKTETDYRANLAVKNI